MNAHTIQLWPAGRTVHYTGEYPHFVNTDSGAEFSEADQRLIQANRLASSYIERDILANDTSLVDALIEAEFDGFSIDDIENVYRSFNDASIQDCRDYILDVGSEDDCPEPNPWTMTREQLAEALTDASIEVRDDESIETLRAAVIANIDDETIDGLDDWRDAANDLASDDPREAYQWFRVSPWLCGKLRAHGEIVIDNGYGEYWGRSCCGQGIEMDGTIQDIALSILDQ